MEDPILDFFGFVKTTSGVRACVGCSIVYTEFRNPFVHRSGCPWIRAIFVLLGVISQSELNDNAFIG